MEEFIQIIIFSGIAVFAVINFIRKANKNAKNQPDKVKTPIRSEEAQDNLNYKQSTSKMKQKPKSILQEIRNLIQEQVDRNDPSAKSKQIIQKVTDNHVKKESRLSDHSNMFHFEGNSKKSMVKTENSLIQDKYADSELVKKIDIKTKSSRVPIPKNRRDNRSTPIANLRKRFEKKPVVMAVMMSEIFNRKY